MKEEYVKSPFDEITEKLKRFVDKDTIMCPNCEKIFEWNDVNYDPAESTYTCPYCLKTEKETDFEKVSMYDYLQDMYCVYKEKENGKV